MGGTRMDQDFPEGGGFGRTGLLSARESNAEFCEAEKPAKRARRNSGKAEPTPAVILPRRRTAPSPLAICRSLAKRPANAPQVLTQQERLPDAEAADALWAEFMSAFGDAGKLNLQAIEAQYKGLRAIARLYRHHAGQWSYFLASKKIKRVRTAKSDFQPLVKFGLSLSRDANGQATKLAVVLDEWAKADPPIPPDEIPQWLKRSGGVKGVYQAVRDRERPQVTKDERDSALHELIELGFVWETDTPDQLAALDGDYLALVHLDSIRRTVGFRAIDPKVDQGWLRSNAKRLVASQAAFGRAPTPTRSDVALS
jgi:hypothetical protein